MAQFGRDKVNVLSYYAVSNAIDGQPLIDRRNVLRFYPVFALQDSVAYVKVIVYHGNEVSVADAVRFLHGHYWESQLPEFDIGEAIQRYEVEVGMNYELDYKRRLELLQKKILDGTAAIESKFKEIDSKIQSDALPQHLDSVLSKLTAAGDELNQLQKNVTALNKDLGNIPPEAPPCCKNLKELSPLIRHDEGQFRKTITRLNVASVPQDSILIYQDTLAAIQARLLERLATFNCCSPTSTIINNYANTLQTAAQQIQLLKDSYAQLTPGLQYLGSLQESFLTSTNQMGLAQLITSQQTVTDSIKSKLLRELTDKTFTGDGVQKSDIVFNNDHSGFKILYRNYRQQNRSQVALDPAEKLSIFRLRYVPFPVVANRLEGPSGKNTPVVFEIGVNFGNELIASNEYVRPELSLKRLGIAVAVTPKLFSEDAQILALALTYEFNVYASIGAGFNFGVLNENTAYQPYFSFGINQKAFQRLISGIAQIFE